MWDATTFEKLKARIPVFRRNTIRALEERHHQRSRKFSTEKEVASLLNLSTKTVETHSSNIKRKESVRAGFLEKGQWVNVSSRLELQSLEPKLSVVIVATDNEQRALRGIELLHQEVPESAIFAIGSLSQPRVIVNAIRAGAREFIERPTTTAALLEAFARLTRPTSRPELLS